ADARESVRGGTRRARGGTRRRYRPRADLPPARTFLRAAGSERGAAPSGPAAVGADALVRPGGVAAAGAGAPRPDRRRRAVHALPAAGAAARGERPVGAALHRL